jgi:putative addiction module killer protein
MVEVRQTPVFRAWLEALTDQRAIERIAQRIVRLQAGLLGDVKSVSGGVSELRIDHGPGYRIYFTRRGQTLILLLCGGDKGSQQRDIRGALSLALDVEDQI